MADYTIKSIHDAAATVRGRRQLLGLSQDQLAKQAGVSRKWVYEFEGGKSRAEFSLVLRVFLELGLQLSVAPTFVADAGTSILRITSAPGPVNLDEVLDDLRPTSDPASDA
jgi:HTH-type transcriptional regulator / antitoxin HipB